MFPAECVCELSDVFVHPAESCAMINTEFSLNFLGVYIKISKHVLPLL